MRRLLLPAALSAIALSLVSTPAHAETDIETFEHEGGDRWHAAGVAGEPECNGGTGRIVVDRGPPEQPSTPLELGRFSGPWTVNFTYAVRPGERIWLQVLCPNEFTGGEHWVAVSQRTRRDTAAATPAQPSDRRTDGASGVPIAVVSAGIVAAVLAIAALLATRLLRRKRARREDRPKLHEVCLSTHDAALRASSDALTRARSSSEAAAAEMRRELDDLAREIDAAYDAFEALLDREVVEMETVDRLLSSIARESNR